LDEEMENHGDGPTPVLQMRAGVRNRGAGWLQVR
jgi:hypothetical protein